MLSPTEPVSNPLLDGIDAELAHATQMVYAELAPALGEILAQMSASEQLTASAHDEAAATRATTLEHMNAIHAAMSAFSNDMQQACAVPAHDVEIAE